MGVSPPNPRARNAAPRIFGACHSELRPFLWQPMSAMARKNTSRGGGMGLAFMAKIKARSPPSKKEAQSVVASTKNSLRRARRSLHGVPWWCPGADSNHRHADFQSAALPTELPGRLVLFSLSYCFCLGKDLWGRFTPHTPRARNAALRFFGACHGTLRPFFSNR